LLCEFVVPVRKVGQLVHDGVGSEGFDCGPQGVEVVDVADHGLASERLELRRLARRAGHRGYDVTFAVEQRKHPNADHAAGSREEDAHLLRQP
jgi:hypothetical protein